MAQTQRLHALLVACTVSKKVCRTLPNLTCIVSSKPAGGSQCVDRPSRNSLGAGGVWRADDRTPSDKTRKLASILAQRITTKMCCNWTKWFPEAPPTRKPNFRFATRLSCTPSTHHPTPNTGTSAPQDWEWGGSQFQGASGGDLLATNQHCQAAGSGSACCISCPWSARTKQRPRGISAHKLQEINELPIMWRQPPLNK